jgi:hypothetical protein
MTLLLINTRIFVGASDLTSQSNHVEIDAEADGIDTTTFGSAGFHENDAGLFDTSINASGFWAAGNAGQVDDRLWADKGTTQPFTCGPDGAAVGNLAWLVQSLELNYKLLGDVGDAAPYNLDGAGDSPLVRGAFLHDPSVARTATINGAGVQLAAVPAGAKLWAALHVLEATGTTPSMTVTIQSDDNAPFSSATSRIVFDPATAISTQMKSLAGPITDDRFRASIVISGTGPSFKFALAVGIG